MRCTKPFSNATALPPSFLPILLMPTTHYANRSCIPSMRNLRDLFLAMYQLWMPAFADDVECYCRELSDTSPTFAPNTPIAFSSPLTDKELHAVKHSEAHWTGNFGQTPLSPNHPRFDEACFHCHHLGHIHINCQFYTCPTCLRNALDHVQNHCPLHHRYNPTCTLSSLSSSSNYSTSSTRSVHLVPPPLADQLSSPPPQ